MPASLALVVEIGRFLALHRLEVSSFTLAIAHDYLTGEDARLLRLIDSRLQACGGIDRQWLEMALSDPDPGSDRKAMSALMVKMQSNIEEFGRTTADARSAASAYGSALAKHVDSMQRRADSADMVAEIARLAAAMLDRSRELERAMTRSELQTRGLQRRLDDARRNAEKDHLTGLPNRRAFETRLAQEVGEARESHEPLCVAICDIDHFKAVNDTHGHEAGDRVLKSVAQALARISNDRCHVARHGGEEFVVLLRGQSLGECWELLDEVRAQQAERKLVNRATDVPFGRVTFSAGLADIFAFADPRAALRAADQALYRAKSGGRNRVIIARPETAELAA